MNIEYQKVLSQFNELKTFRERLVYRLEEEDKFKHMFFNMFQIDLETYFKIEYRIIKEFHMSFSEIDSLEYYRYQIFLENFKEDVQKEKEHYDKEKQEMSKQNLMSNAQNIFSQSQSKFKLPNFSDIKIPKIK